MEVIERLTAFLEEGSYQVLAPLILVAFALALVYGWLSKSEEPDLPREDQS